MNATNAMLCWDPDSDHVALLPWPDTARRSDRYRMTTLACNAELHQMTLEQRKTQVFIEAMHLIIRDNCDPKAVHRALMGLDEYRHGCSPDMPGMPGATPLD